MHILIWGIAIGTIGKLVIGLAVLRVHVYILREHKIDQVVLQALKREQYVTFVGLILIIIGFSLEMLFYYGPLQILSCTGNDCVAAVNATFMK